MILSYPQTPCIVIRKRSLAVLGTLIADLEFFLQWFHTTEADRCWKWSIARTTTQGASVLCGGITNAHQPGEGNLTHNKQLVKY